VDIDFREFLVGHLHSGRVVAEALSLCLRDAPVGLDLD
jgi:hypothetical protein